VIHTTSGDSEISYGGGSSRPHKKFCFLRNHGDDGDYKNLPTVSISDSNRHRQYCPVKVLINPFGC